MEAEELAPLGACGRELPGVSRGQPVEPEQRLWTRPPLFGPPSLPRSTTYAPTDHPMRDRPQKPPPTTAFARIPWSLEEHAVRRAFGGRSRRNRTAHRRSDQEHAVRRAWGGQGTAPAAGQGKAAARGRSADRGRRRSTRTELARHSLHRAPFLLRRAPFLLHYASHAPPSGGEPHRHQGPPPARGRVSP